MATKTPRKLDALIRVSRVDGREGESFRSPGQQRESCERWAAANGAEIVHWHEGLGRSGKTMHREDVDAAVDRIRAGLTEGVIVAWLDRFSRAPVAEALTVIGDINGAGGQVVACDMAGIDPSDATGEMALTVMLGVNRLQWRKIAERYDQTRREAITDGKAIGGAPFGYLFKDPTPKNRSHGVADSRLVPDPECAPIVAAMFERKAGGATWLELARWLDEVAPKSNGAKWARSTVGSMVKCRTYLGEVRHGEHVNPTAHEPIVGLALWRRAQNKPGRRTPRGTYLLSGLLRCAGCGRNLRGSALGGGRGYRIYNCAAATCKAKATMVVHKADTEVVEQFFAHLDAFHVRAVTDAEMEAARAEVERLTDALEAVASVVPIHLKAVAAHQDAMAQTESELVDAEDRLHQLTASLEAGGPDARTLREDWDSLTLDEQREILRAGIDAVLVRRGASRGSRPPARERILVLFRGEAPGALLGIHPVTAWAWDNDPGSLVPAA